MKNINHSLAGKISNVFCTLNLVLVTIIIGIILCISTKVMCDEVSDYTGEILRHISYQFNNYLGYSLEKLLSVYRAGKFPGLMGQENYTPQEMLNLDRRLNESLQNTSLYDKLISDILIIGKNGYVYNTQERSNLQSGYPFEEQDWFKEYILSNTGDNNHICLIPAHPCDYYNPYHGTSDNEVFSMGMKITDKNGEYLGELLFNFNIQEVSELLNLGNYEHNGDIYLLDTKGNIIFQSSIFPVSGSSFEISEEKKAEIYNNHAGNFFTKIGGTFSLITQTSHLVRPSKNVENTPKIELSTMSFSAS